MRSTAEADYRYLRSMDACGGGGVREGMLEADLRSVHPYAGRKVGDGWVWGTIGAGRGEASVVRCESGERSEADMSMRLAAAGGRHVLRLAEGFALSLVEDIGQLRLTTGASSGPVGDRGVSVGRARVGLEASGVASPDCRCWLTTYARVLARGDWGDGNTGAGIEVETGVRLRNLNRRLGLDAGLRTVALHSSESLREYGIDLAVSLLPKMDGTGLQLAVVSKRGRVGEAPARWQDEWRWSWDADGEQRSIRRSEARLGYGIRSAGGITVPFIEVEGDDEDRPAYRAGLRYAAGGRPQGLVVEWVLGRAVLLGRAERFAMVVAEVRF